MRDRHNVSTSGWIWNKSAWCRCLRTKLCSWRSTKIMPSRLHKLLTMNLAGNPQTWASFRVITERSVAIDSILKRYYTLQWCYLCDTALSLSIIWFLICMSLSMNSPFGIDRRDTMSKLLYIKHWTTWQANSKLWIGEHENAISCFIRNTYTYFAKREVGNIKSEQIKSRIFSRFCYPLRHVYCWYKQICLEGNSSRGSHHT